MVLAAGLGTRMRPLTDDRPKALVEVGGKALIDHMLDRLAEAGVRRAVVNVHAFADRLIAHLNQRVSNLDIAISDEREHPLPLETGGGIKFARSLLGEDVILVGNIDSVWIEYGPSTIQRLAEEFEPAQMDIRQLVTDRKTALGYDRAGDFFVDSAGQVAMRGSAPSAPFVQMGVHMVMPRLVYDRPETTFGLFDLWVEVARSGRMFATVLEGQWMHVGDPQALKDAEARLAQVR